MARKVPESPRWREGTLSAASLLVGLVLMGALLSSGLNEVSIFLTSGTV
jgi:hypothetical protein